ncbi:MAG: sacsin N-terminal ATP-binding-like domain-containing protein [Janthinobacterium lividum]
MNRNNYMLSARDIFKTLKELRQNKKLSNRRWVWELLQNAKDVDNRFEWVSVVVEHTPTHLRFRHNGNPFSIDNLTSLIQQVSSKLSDSSNKAQTGKWGTGFISTHLLATIIHVAGVVDCEGRGYRRFSIDLDRSGATAEALLDSIRDTSRQVLQLEDNDDAFPPQPQYEERRQRTDYDTEFSYELLAPENREAAAAGIADLLLTLPSALLNVPEQKIKSVQVMQLDGSTLRFQVELVQQHGAITGYTVTSSADTPGVEPTHRHFYAYETSELRLLAEVMDFAAPALVPPSANQPVLYRDFPLIGSERFHFPFALNSSDFYPNERRDGIFLNAAEDWEIQRNRELLAAAQVAALDFTRWLLAQNVRNRYVLANTRVPEVPGDGLDADARKWYEQLQTAWRHELRELPLVETEAGIPVPLSEVRIPRFRANASQEDNDALWALAADFLGAAAVPRRDLLPDWIRAMGVEEELESWGKIIFLTPEDLLRLAADCGSLAALPMHQGEHGSKAAAIAWLNELYAYLAAHSQLSLLNDIAAVPNKQGKLCLLDELHVERADEPIPEPVLDVLHKLKLLWRDELAHRDVVLPGHAHKDRGLRNASTEINELLKVRLSPADTLESAFLQRDDAPQILIDLLRLESPNADDATYRKGIFEQAKQLLHVEEDWEKVDSLRYFDLSKAAQLMTLHLNQLISEAETVSGLAALLRAESDDRARFWLGGYLKFLASSPANQGLLKVGNIVPNQLDELCAYEDLYNAGTREQPLDETLLAILKECDQDQDWKPLLLANGIPLELPQRFTFDELGNALTAFANTALASDDYKEHLLPLLHLLEWCRKSEENKELAQKYLGKFYERLSTHWFTLVMDGSGKGDKVMSLLHNPDDIDDLVDIAQSGVDMKWLRQMARLAKNEELLTEMLRYAKQLQADAASFAHLQRIGAQMEEAFLIALKDAGITASIERGEGAKATVAKIFYQGIGSYDFVVRGSNGKSFYIEVKSHKKDNPDPIRLAQSQTKRATAASEPFALCVIGREGSPKDVDIAYVQKNLRYVTNLQATLAPVAIHIGQLEAMKKHGSDAWLDVSQLHGSKVMMTLDFIDTHAQSFGQLVEDIKAVLR